MVWLRIDYNGHGFDAFVTDANLARTRVSFKLPGLPQARRVDAPRVHLGRDDAASRFYVNGKLAGEKAATGVYDAGLDQFGPHSPHHLAPPGAEPLQLRPRRRLSTSSASTTACSRTTDIAALAKAEEPTVDPPSTRTLAGRPTARRMVAALRLEPPERRPRRC